MIMNVVFSRTRDLFNHDEWKAIKAFKWCTEGKLHAVFKYLAIPLEILSFFKVAPVVKFTEAQVITL